MTGDNKSKPFKTALMSRMVFAIIFIFMTLHSVIQIDGFTLIAKSTSWRCEHYRTRPVHTVHSPRFDPRRRTWTKTSSTGGLWPFTLGRWMVISSSLTRTVTTSYCYCSRRGYASGSAPLWLGCVMRRAAENESNWLNSQITHPAVCRPSNCVGYHLRANLATIPKLITETAMLYASWRYFDGGTTCTSLR